MDWDDEYNNGYNNIDFASQRHSSMPDKNAEGGLDPMDIANPVSAYFFLSDDAQDEINGTDKKRMKCLSCGHMFKGEIYDSCPKCDSLNTEEVVSVVDGEEEAVEGSNMKCLSCGHRFTGEIYDNCPECHSVNTEEAVENK